MRTLALLISITLFHLFNSSVHAITDPLSVPNNKIGIHILFPAEIEKAAKLVNNNGSSSWGYVTIPIQSTERDRRTWQLFFDRCRELKVIPIVRVATVPEGSNWAEPNNFDLLDFANFLGDLNWPTQNRYVIIFNEVNRADEYGGFVSPENYADILENAINIFKAKSSDFYILPAGLDNAATNTRNSLNWRLYLERVYLRHPDIFNKIDGWTSHAYPNPDFSQRPDRSGSNKIDSYRSDLKFLRLFTTKKLPVFITETGWSNQYLSDHQISLYYQYVLTHQWTDSNIVAITPFIFSAHDGPFVSFSFLDENNNLKEFGLTYQSFATEGNPIRSNETKEIIATISSTYISPTKTPENTSKTILKKLYNSIQSLIKLFGS